MENFLHCVIGHGVGILFTYYLNRYIKKCKCTNASDKAFDMDNAVYQQCKNRGYTAAVDVLVDVGVLTKAKLEEWRFGKIPYLEVACSCNLRQLNLILKEMRVYSEKSGYKPSFCYYKRWGTKKKNGQGKKPVIPLRFSKSGNASLEKTYATHYVKKEFFSKKEEKIFCEETENFTE